jgi:hypothetical protein
MADTFKHIGAVAINLPIFADKPLNPNLTFKHVSVHVVQWPIVHGWLQDRLQDKISLGPE